MKITNNIEINTHTVILIKIEFKKILKSTVLATFVPVVVTPLYQLYPLKIFKSNNSSTILALLIKHNL